MRLGSRVTDRLARAALAAAACAVTATATAGASDRTIVLRTQGSFMVGGTVITAPNGDTFHGDHRWPEFSSNVAFLRDPASLEQYYRQQTPGTGPAFAPADRHILIDLAAALFEKIGPAILITHSASGRLGWLTALQTDTRSSCTCQRWECSATRSSPSPT